uniref:Uncharacterized protein n=1 Tax=Panagrolaimus sp. ES5 TaxID=591445 RepID=A0AC34FRN1_9BILA
MKLFGAENAENVEPHLLKPMNIKCKGCEAMHLPEERGHENGFYTMCCQKGTVAQLLVDDYPEELKKLWKKEHPDKKLTNNFHENIVSINSSLSFAHPIAKQTDSQAGAIVA